MNPQIGATIRLLALPESIRTVQRVMMREESDSIKSSHVCMTREEYEAVSLMAQAGLEGVEAMALLLLNQPIQEARKKMFSDN